MDDFFLGPAGAVVSGVSIIGLLGRGGRRGHTGRGTAASRRASRMPAPGVQVLRIAADFKEFGLATRSADRTSDGGPTGHGLAGGPGRSATRVPIVALNGAP